MKKNHITRTIIASAVLFSFNAAAATSYFEARNDAMGGTRHTQYTLWDKGVFSGQLPVSTGSHLLTANSDRLSFDWEGDAIELLNELARVRGMQFNYNGVRLPLPVNLHVRDMTFSNTLRLIEAQTAWRATIHQYPGLLQVSFMQPENRKK